jgi:hypothetical protein
MFEPSIDKIISLIKGQIGLVDGTGSKVRVSGKNKTVADLGLNMYLARLSNRGIRTIRILVQQCRRVHSPERYTDEVSRAARSKKSERATMALVIILSHQECFMIKLTCVIQRVRCHARGCS